MTPHLIHDAMVLRRCHATMIALALVASMVSSISAFTFVSPSRNGEATAAAPANRLPPMPIQRPASAPRITTRLKESQKDDDAGSLADSASTSSKKRRPLPVRRAFLLSSLLAGAQLLFANAYAPPGFERVPTQFLAALGDPNVSQGTGAKDWGLWELDPGPRGVWLRNYESQLVSNNNKAPAGWKFDGNDWWLEEHGLIMEAPTFPVAPGRYLVTGGRLVTTVLTIDDSGVWKLDDGKLYDVTHLPCRSARYTPTSEGGSPLTARQSDFPVTPGAEMPKVPGCNKQDYAVLFVIGKEATKEL